MLQLPVIYRHDPDLDNDLYRFMIDIWSLSMLQLHGIHWQVPDQVIECGQLHDRYLVKLDAIADSPGNTCRILTRIMIVTWFLIDTWSQ